METHRRFYSSLSILFLFFPLSSSAYALPEKYFINCGSHSAASIDGRTFVGDVNSGGGSPFSVSDSDALTAGEANPPRSALPPLYRTARVYGKPFRYELPISQNGTYLVRLHFLPFPSSSANLSAAIFDVHASGFLLLSNISVPNGRNLALIKEFLLTINVGKLEIYFEPLSGSLAFVNAIEAFIGFDGGGFAPAGALPLTPAGRPANYSALLSQGLFTVHRVNVGGPVVTPGNDTLWRNWVPDDEYLTNKTAAKNSKMYTEMLSYQSGWSTKYIAPDLVYNTAKEMNIDPVSGLGSFNITWSFGVRKNARHLVRAHFCDVVSLSSNVIRFNIYIYSTFGREVDTFSMFGEHLATPFYFDFVVDSDNSGLLNVSVGPRTDSLQQNAYLNGLEIMEFMRESKFSMLQSESGKKKLPLVLGLAIGGVGLICILMIVVFLGLKCRKVNGRKVESAQISGSPSFLLYRGSSLSNEGTAKASPITNLNLGLKIPLADIMSATNKFNAKLLIGEGGFGKVYKGTFRDGRTVAVKRSEPGHGQGVPEFHTEILLLSKIRHRHLVSLLGYCDDWPEMILVYEFMEKGTLRDHLYNLKLADSKKSYTLSPLTWKQRLEICIGSAQGLHYLHSSSDRGIIHRDVKSTNILLDEHYVAKVADFGLSRARPPDQTHVSTDVKGSIGYLDPEYFRCLQLTEKSDVYSFGVVLLEVLCARPAINTLLPREQVNLAEWGLFWYYKGELEKIVDPLLLGTINPNSLRKFGETVEKCLREHGADRPSMGDVLWDLEYALQLQQTGVNKEPHEDSTMGTSLGLSLPVIQHLPSASFSNEDTLMETGGFSDITMSDVISEIRIDDAR